MKNKKIDRSSPFSLRFNTKHPLHLCGPLPTSDYECVGSGSINFHQLTICEGKYERLDFKPRKLATKLSFLWRSKTCYNNETHLTMWTCIDSYKWTREYAYWKFHDLNCICYIPGGFLYSIKVCMILEAVCSTFEYIFFYLISHNFLSFCLSNIFRLHLYKAMTSEFQKYIRLRLLIILNMLEEIQIINKNNWEKKL